MKIGLVTEALPNPGTSGGDTVNWTIIQQLRAAGHEIDPCCLLINQWAAERPDVMQRHLAALAAQGLQPHALRIPADAGPDGRPGRADRWRQAVWPDADRLFPARQLAPQLRRLLEAARPDAVFVFDTGTVAAMQDVRVAPRLGVPGDPPHLVHAYRRRLPRREGSRLQGLAARAAGTLWSWRVEQLVLRMLDGYEALGMLGAQHAAWLQRNGMACTYLRPTVTDLAGASWQARRDAVSPRSKPKILILGNHAGTASLTGLYPFAEVTLPLLEQALGPGGFEIHLVGKGPLPAALERRFRRPSVKVRGYVEDITREYLSCDIFCSPTPYPVGVRTRVIEALAFGCCVVTDSSSALGLPELVHDENVVLASAGRGWAEAIVSLVRDPGRRRRLGASGRRTYEWWFRPEVAVGAIIDELLRIAQERAPRAPSAAQPASTLLEPVSG